MVSKKGVITFLNKSGYPLEMYVKDMLLNNKWDVFPNQYYFDKDGQQPREYDIRAEKEISGENQKYLIKIILMIQCKKIPNNAWVFFSGPQAEYQFGSFPYLVTVLDALGLNSEGAITKIRGPLVFSALHYDKGFLSSGYAEFVMNHNEKINDNKKKDYSNKNLWDAEITIVKVHDSIINNCLNERIMNYTLEEIRDRGVVAWVKAGAFQVIYVLYPIIIFEGEICTAKFPLTEENINDENYIKLLREIKSSNYNFYGTIDIIKKDYLKTYLAELNIEINKIISSIEKNWGDFIEQEFELITNKK